MVSHMTIALAGNPNSGKTTMFNALTGARQHVGNWPGVTVEKKSGTIQVNGGRMDIIDLPGAYSLTAYTQEELVARNYLVEERPQAVVNVLNAGALERNLYLTVQFLELGIPVVAVLNMMDEVLKQGKTIDTVRLAQVLDCPVVEAVARRGEGKEELVREALRWAREREGAWKPLNISYGPDLDPLIRKMEGIIEEAGFLTELIPSRWTALKYLESDPEIMRKGVTRDKDVSNRLEEMTRKATEHIQATLGTSPEAIIADYRYGFIAALVRECVTRQNAAFRLDMSDRIDRVLTHRVLGPVIMVAVIYFIYKATFAIGEIPMGWLESFFGVLGGWAEALLPEGLVRSLIVSGIIDGVGGVLGFTPLIVIMFLLISALEDSGYMARMAYMLDRVFKIFGLHGNSVLPFIISGGIAGGCAVPGVMATRTLRSPKEKLATLLTVPFMTCGAKVPVFLMLAAAFFPDSSARVMFLITLGAWAAALIVSKLLRSTIIRGEPTPFVMELPPYRLPTLKGILIHTWERSWEYVRKAGTVILAVSILLWAAMTFPQLPEKQRADYRAAQVEVQAELARAQTPAQARALEGRLAEVQNEQAMEAILHTFAGRVGTALEPLSEPAGFNWRLNIALFGGVAAKEVIVSTLGTAYSMGAGKAEDSAPLSLKLARDPAFSKATALSMIVFVLLYAPCFVTLIAMGREAGWKWSFFALFFNTVLAYGLAVGVYQLARAVL